MDDDTEEGKFPPFAIRRRKGKTPAEQEFLDSSERIAEEVAAWSDEEVAAYLKENDLEHLVTPERIEALLAAATGDTQKAAAKLVVVWDRDKDKPKNEE